MLAYEFAFSVEGGSEISVDPTTEKHLSLWAAVFRQGLFDYAETLRFDNQVPLSTTGKPRVALEPGQRRAVHWVNSSEAHPGSFVWLCDLFDLDPDQVRLDVARHWRTLHMTPHTRPRQKE